MRLTAAVALTAMATGKCSPSCVLCTLANAAVCVSEPVAPLCRGGAASRVFGVLSVQVLTGRGRGDGVAP